jgi:gamma-glutamylputrescine oxidase
MASGAITDNVPVWDRGEADASARLGFPSLTGDVDADYCVIGLGGSGLASITELLRAGVDATRIVALDASTVGSGAAGRNGGFLLAGIATFYHDAIRAFGRDRARRVYELTMAQIEAIAAETPDAVRRTGSLRIASSNEERLDCAEHLAALRADGFPAESYEGPEGVGLLVPSDCAFDPLRRVRTLACRVAGTGVRLFERSAVREVERGSVRTQQGRVRCDRVIVAVDGKLGELLPELRARARDVRLQMLATAPTTEIEVPRPVYARWGYDYWQQLGDGVLVLGGFRDFAGDNEWTSDAHPTELVQARLDRFLRDELRVYAPVTHRWAATVSYSANGLPVLEEVRPGVFAAGAYSGTGNVIGALCGRAMARLALGESSEVAELLACDSRPTMFSDRETHGHGRIES